MVVLGWSTLRRRRYAGGRGLRHQAGHRAARHELLASGCDHPRSLGRGRCPRGQKGRHWALAACSVSRWSALATSAIKPFQERTHAFEQAARWPKKTFRPSLLLAGSQARWNAHEMPCGMSVSEDGTAGIMRLEVRWDQEHGEGAQRARGILQRAATSTFAMPTDWHCYSVATLRPVVVARER